MPIHLVEYLRAILTSVGSRPVAVAFVARGSRGAVCSSRSHWWLLEL